MAVPADDPGYLVQAAEHPDAAKIARLRKTSCDIAASKVCAGAWSQGYRLSADYYLGDRAMREPGFDTSFRMGPFGGSTHHYAPVDLNSLLYRYERDLHDFAVRALGRGRRGAARGDRQVPVAPRPGHVHGRRLRQRQAVRLEQRRVPEAAGAAARARRCAVSGRSGLGHNRRRREQGTRIAAAEVFRPGRRAGMAAAHAWRHRRVTAGVFSQPTGETA
jgi:hypothetical protein